MLWARRKKTDWIAGEAPVRLGPDFEAILLPFRKIETTAKGMDRRRIDPVILRRALSCFLLRTGKIAGCFTRPVAGS
jgi:hypothetical protein